MKVPNWLKQRSLVYGIPDDICNFARNENILFFGDLSLRSLERYYHKYSGKALFRLARLLGFYGVIFYNKLKHYSGPDIDNPKVLFVPTNHRADKIANCEIYSNTKSLLISCGIISLYHLHGVPLQSFNKLIGSYDLDDIKYSLFFPLEISSATNLILSEEISGAAADKPLKKQFEQDEILSSAKELATKGIGLDALNLSVRSRNCLEAGKIDTVKGLTQCSDKELLAIPNFGITCLNEIKEKLSVYGLGNGEKNTAVRTLDLGDIKTLSNLNIAVKDLTLNRRTQNCFENSKIKYVWQLVQLREKELFAIKNLGRKSIGELKNIVSDMSLSWGLKFNDEDIGKIRSYEKSIDEEFVNNWLRDSVKYLSSYPLPFLKEIEQEIVKKRIFANKFSEVTLETLAKSHEITRERIRQLEKSALRKIKQYLNPELRDVTGHLEAELSNLGYLANFKDISGILNQFKSKEQVIINQLIKLQTENIFIDWRNHLISGKGSRFIEDICIDIKDVIYEEYSEGIFTTDQLSKSAQKISTRYSIFSDGRYNNLIQNFIKYFKVARDGKYLSLGKLTKGEKIALAFKELYPDGLAVYKRENELLTKIIKFDPKLFGNATHRSVVSNVVRHPNILLWKRGYYIHEQNLNYESDAIGKVIRWILDHFDAGNSRFQVSIPFYQFNEELISSGIPNQYALYSLIRKQEIDRIGQRKFPTIVDLEASENLEDNTSEELETFFLEQETAVAYHDLKNEFVHKRGWKEYSVQNICANSESVFPWKENTYIHLDYLNVNYSKLNDLLEALRIKLQSIKGPYNLKGAKKEMGLLWEQTCPSATVRTIIKLIRQSDPDDLTIERNLIWLSKNVPESVSIEASLEEYFLERNKEVTRHELKEEFLGNRGWSDIQLYNAMKSTNIFPTGNVTYVHPATINWNGELSRKVYEVLIYNIKERNELKIPHMQIGTLIYEYVLPELSNSIEWTRQLLISVGSEYEEFLFFQDSYILTENKFDIEDLDDMIGFLIAKEFEFGIGKRKEVEKLLWRECILLPGHKISKNQFFDGSSICFSEDNDEVFLSEIGKDRYGRKL